MSLDIKAKLGKWQDSQTGIQFMKDLRDGSIDPRTYVPKTTWLSRDVYQEWPLINFRSNAGRNVKAFVDGKFILLINIFILSKKLTNKFHFNLK